MQEANVSEQVPIREDSPEEAGGATFKTWVLLIFLVYLLILAVGMIGSGFKWASGGAEGARELFAFARNPFMGLIVGVLATALVQSSSTVTSIIVALCAGGMPVGVAVPMVMGANIGTTITNTLVSLGHVRQSEGFRRAFAAATVHDFFNILSVVLFLPLEMAFHLLERVGLVLAEAMTGGSAMSMNGLNFVGAVTKPVVNGVQGLFGALPGKLGAILLILAGLGLIFFTIYQMGRILRRALSGRARHMVEQAVGRGPIRSIGVGAVVTVLVQSSSTTTSLIVPLAGTGLVTLSKVYPFTLGANIGTTITALLAATSITGEPATFALQIALIHLLYNLVGVLVIYGLPFLRSLPMKAAEALAETASRRRPLALAYVVVVFFMIPGLLLGASSLGSH
jgi:sodium-dependent phosphate cotransporter